MSKHQKIRGPDRQNQHPDPDPDPDCVSDQTMNDLNEGTNPRTHDETAALMNDYSKVMNEYMSYF